MWFISHWAAAVTRMEMSMAAMTAIRPVKIDIPFPDDVVDALPRQDRDIKGQRTVTAERSSERITRPV